MERVGLGRVTVRQSEVDCDSKADLAASEDVLEEGVSHLEIQLCESHLVGTERSELLIGDRELACVFLDLSKSQARLAAVLVFTRLLGDEEVNADLALDIISCKI